MQRPPGIYTSTLSRRGLARRRARLRGPWPLRPWWWIAGLLAAVAACVPQGDERVIDERLMASLGQARALQALYRSADERAPVAL